LIGLSYSTVTDWEGRFDENLVPLPKEKHRRRGGVEEGLVQLILKAFDEFNPERTRYKLKTFLRYLKKNCREELRVYPVGMSRKTIAEILEAHGRYQRKRKTKRHDPGGAVIERLYPGAQTGVDGKEMKISLENQEYTFNCEMAQDLASQKMTSFIVSDTEDAAAVKGVIISSEKAHPAPVGYLSDNGSGNKAAHSATPAVWNYTFPSHPKTNGILEGEFSKIEEVIGRVKIMGTTAKERAQSILEVVLGIYTRMRNATPRCIKCPFSPDELMNYHPTPEEKQKAWDMLTARQKEREKARIKKGSSDLYALCEHIIQQHRLHLYCSHDEYIRKVSRFDKDALLKADVEFAVYSQRDSFDDSKRNGNYFYAIVKAKQQEKDDARRKEHLRERYIFEEKKRQESKEEQFTRSEQEARAQKESNPVDYVVKWMKTGFSLKDPALREKFSVFKEKVRDGLVKIFGMRSWKDTFQYLKEALMACAEFSLEVRKEMIDYISSEMAHLQPTG
jgi:hypothetical protein